MQKYRNTLLAILVATLSFVVAFQPVYAQGGSLVYGDSVNATLAPDTVDLWTFDGTAGDKIIISMESNEFDPLVTLKDADGQEIGQDDNGGDVLNAVLEATLPADGEFTIEASSAFAGSGGAYTLSLNLATDSGENGDDSDGEDENPFEIVLDADGVLEDGSSSLQTFVGSEGDVIAITADSEDFDTVIELLDPDGESLAEDDDSGTDLNSLIVIQVASDGEYTVEVTAYLDDGGGDYHLNVTSGAYDIEIDETVEGEFADQSIVYAFEAEENAEITVALGSEDFDTVVELRDSAGQSIIQDDDSGGDLDSLLSTTLSEAGTYFIIVKSFSGDEEGDYTLTLSSGLTEIDTFPEIPSFDVEPVDGGTIRYGDTISGLAENAPVAFTFEGSAGDEITISLNSDDFDAYLQLLDADGNVINEDDDSGGDLNALLEQTLPEDGTYTVVAGAFFTAPTGEFTLTLSN